MTLSERLERAKRERMLAAGLLHSEAALKPEAEIDVTDSEAGSSMSYGIEIEAAASGLHSVGPVSTQTKVATPPVLAGERTPSCPNCRRPGNVDLVDMIGNAVHMSCAGCGTLWRVPRSSA